MVDFYKVLGVSDDADGAQIKLAFRALAKVHHPDLHAGDKLAERRFQTINGAYAVLSKPKARAAYDAARALQRSDVRRRTKSAAVAMAASFLLTVTSGLALAGWMRIEGFI
jgi:DnaJ-class molecular chaperone